MNSSLSSPELLAVRRGLGNPWAYRHFIAQAVKSDIRRQFARSFMGASWLIVQPLARAAIFAFVFSELLIARLPGLDRPNAYTMYLMAGMAAWGLFSDIVTRSSTIFLEFASIIKKAPVPLLCVPLVACGVAVLSHVVLMATLGIVSVAIYRTPGIAWLAILPASVIMILFGAGIGLLSGVLNVFRRDVGQFTSIGLQIWFWMTPIVYVSKAIPAKYSWMIEWNPLSPVVAAYQDALVHGTFVSAGTLIVPALLATSCSALGIALLDRAQSDMVDGL